MPKETFFNLSAQKRERFVNAAMDEFARNDYRGASVSRIVEKAGIAKGSVYQYFESKKDLYSYLVSRAAEAKFAFIDSSVPEEAKGFFERYKQTVFHGAKFDFSRPRLAGVLYNATYESSGPETAAISTMLRTSTLDYIRDLVEAGIREGDLRDDIDIDFAAYGLYQLTISLRDYLAFRFDFSMKDAVRKGTAGRIGSEELLPILDELTELFRRGLAAKARKRRRGSSPIPV